MEHSQIHLKSLLEKWKFAPTNNLQPPEGKKTLWRRLYGYWMGFAKVLGKINTIVLLTLVYVVIIGPVALVLKVFGRDLLDRRPEPRSSYWYEKTQEDVTLERSKQQF
jgi:hypothetical protein